MRTKLRLLETINRHILGGQVIVELHPPEWATGNDTPRDDSLKSEDSRPPQRAIDSRAEAPPMPILGALAPFDNFEVKLAEFAKRRGIDISRPGGRMFALEIAARGNPEIAKPKRARGRPRKPRLWEVIEDLNTLREMEDIKASRRSGGYLSDADALALSSSKTAYNSERGRANKASAIRKRTGKPGRRGKLK